MKITLCGSARHEEQFHIYNKYLTLQGHIVYSLAVCPSIQGKKDWYTTAQKEVLDRVHKQKILNSDAIFVINAQDYIGDSTKSEILFAREHGKRVIWAYKFNSKCGMDHPADEYPTCPHLGCADMLNNKQPCALCYE